MSLLTVKPKLPEDFEAVTWSKLQAAVQAVHTKQPVATSLEELYRVRLAAGVVQSPAACLNQRLHCGSRSMSSRIGEGGGLMLGVLETYIAFQHVAPSDVVGRIVVVMVAGGYLKWIGRETCGGWLEEGLLSIRNWECSVPVCPLRSVRHLRLDMHPDIHHWRKLSPVQLHNNKIRFPDYAFVYAPPLQTGC